MNVKVLILTIVTQKQSVSIRWDPLSANVSPGTGIHSKKIEDEAVGNAKLVMAKHIAMEGESALWKMDRKCASKFGYI